MELYIFRHALADFSKQAPDPENPSLTQEGRSQVKHVTSISRKLGFMPNVIVSSPLVRARETAELAKKTLALNSKVLIEENLLGAKKPEQVYQFLRKMSKSDKILLVSHQPLIDRLMSDLLGGKSKIHFINGAIACIEVGSKPARGKGSLTWFLPPPNPIY